MINIIYFCLLLIYATSVTNHIPGFVISTISVLFFVIAYKTFKTRSNKTTALVQIMCYSIPLSFRNVLGGDYSDLPVTWFYLIGAVLLIHLLSLKKEIKITSSLSKVTLLVVLVIIFTVIPLLLTNSAFISQGFSQFIILSFHNIIILAAILKGNILGEHDAAKIEKTYITAGFITSLGIITQFILFKYGTIIGAIQYHNNRVSFNFLFSDASHSTLYLATTAFLSILLLSYDSKYRTLKHTLIPIVILIGAGITSARTGLIVFFAVFIMYIFIGQKGITKKLFSTLLGVIALVGAVLLFKTVRTQGSITDVLFDSSGRSDGYNVAIDMFLEKPFLGYGFSKDYIAGLMGYPIPHFSFLQYLIHAGIFYTVMIFGIIAFAYFYAKKRKMNESWLILMTVIGTCLIPDIFSTRYITLLMLMVFLKTNHRPQHSI